MAPSLRPLDTYPITTRALEVLRVAAVTPGMRRVTLGGPALAAHTAPNGLPVAAFRSEGFDDEFKILLKHPDASETVVPVQADGVLDWPRGNPHLLLRTYTVRRWDPQAGEVDVDFVDHGSGPATSWAGRVEPGETVHIAGPKMSLGHPEGADWTLIAGDETALPAIGRWLETWPEGERAQVFIEIAADDHRQDLPVPDGVEVTWLSRDGAEPGTTTLLFDAIREAEWWEGTAFAWAAGEAGTLAPIRRWLREERCLPRERMDVTGYWRRRPSEGVDERAVFHELSEIAPGFALRVAATIGLAAAFDGKRRALDQLAAATGSDPTGLGRLLRYLEAIGVAEAAGEDRYRLTGLGRELEAPHTAEPLRLDASHARRELGGMLSLLSAVRTGRGDHARWFGAEHAEHVLADPALLASRMDDEAEEAAYLAGALAAARPLAGLSSIEITGRAAAVFADALVKARPGLEAAVVAPEPEIAVFRARYGPSERLVYRAVADGDSGEVDAVLLSGALNDCDDEAAVRALRRAAARLRSGGRLLVLDELLDPALAGEHEYEDDLIEFALSGGGLRTHRQYADLFTKAAFDVPERHTIGWGYTLYTLRP